MTQPATTPSPSPFSSVSATLAEMGLAVMPCGPGTKFPGRYTSADGWFTAYDWQKYCERLPTSFELDVWDRWPDAGVCLALGRSSAPGGLQLIAVDIDSDDPVVVAAIRSALPGSPVRKRGAKGETEFYLAPASVPNRPYNDAGKVRLLDLLGHGRQTVLPPSIHPSTNQPYVWTTLDTLENFSTSDLPILPADIADRLGEALAQFGYEAPPVLANGEADPNVEASTHRQLNDAALANLAAWVPSLGLYKCRQIGSGYKAVASWRPSSSGRPLSARATNLIISAKGIKDKGAEEGYTPLDLVMAACECSLDSAFRYLQERVAPAAPITLTAKVKADVPVSDIEWPEEDEPALKRTSPKGNLAFMRLAAVHGERVDRSEPGEEPQPEADEGADDTPQAIVAATISRLREIGTPEAMRLMSAIYTARTEAPRSARDEPELTNAADLMAMKFPPIKWVVPGFIPEGLTFLCGAPKIGKSWMALGLGLEVASGGKAFGEIECQAGGVLYLALEDNLRRLQSRLQHMGVASAPAALTLTTTWPTVDEDCVGKLEDWIDANPDARMIVVDVFAKIRSAKGGNKPQYDVDYKDVTSLQRLAINRGVAIIVVHHTRKMESDDPFDAVSGTRGLTGSADSTFVLTRASGQAKPALYGRGRDIEEIERAMEFDGATGRWSIAGPVVELASSPERQAILDLLREVGGPMQLADIAERLKKERANVNQMLKRLIENGTVRKAGTGWYELTRPVGEVKRPWSAASSTQ